MKIQDRSEFELSNYSSRNFPVYLRFIGTLISEVLNVQIYYANKLYKR